MIEFALGAGVLFSVFAGRSGSGIYLLPVQPSEMSQMPFRPTAPDMWVPPLRMALTCSVADRGSRARLLSPIPVRVLFQDEMMMVGTGLGWRHGEEYS